MFCPKCGHALPDGSGFCSACGSPISQPAAQPTTPPPVYTAPTAPPPQPQPVYAQSGLSFKDFYNLYVSKKSKGNLIWLVVICFITAAISIPMMITAANDTIILLGIMDIAVYSLMAVLLLITKHWVCALLPTVYSGTWTVVNMALGGTPSGIVALVIGVATVMTLFKADKAYRYYQATGMAPAAPL